MAGRKKSASPSPAGEGVVAKKKKAVVAPSDQTEPQAAPAENAAPAVTEPAAEPIGDQAQAPEVSDAAPVVETPPAVEPEQAEPEQETDVFTPVVLSITNNSPSKQSIAKVQIAPHSTVTVEVTTAKRLSQIQCVVEQLNNVSRKSGWGERITLAQV